MADTGGYMSNLLDGGAEQLEEVRMAIANMAKKEQELKDSDRAFKAKQKEYELQQKRVADKITAAIKKERADVEKEHEGILNEASKAVKEAEHQKKNAKSAAVNLRIQEETFDYVTENKRLAAENSDIMKKGKLPFFCKNPMYYSLFSPVSKLDYLICSIAIVIFAGIIPFVVSLFLKTAVVKALVWTLIILFFAAIYFVVFTWTRKGSKNEYVTLMRPNAERIAANKATIKKFNKDIKSDPDESRYNLGAFDEKLGRAKYDYESKTQARDEALKYFDDVRSEEIKNSIQTENEASLNELNNEVEALKAENAAKNDEYSAASNVFNDYKAELGDKNMTPDRINELMGLINEGKAFTVKEALMVQQNKGKQQ